MTIGSIFLVIGALNGLFSVSETDKVQFAQGNLQYQASTDTWRFADHQYDVVGNAAGNTTPMDAGRASQAAWIDLFGWATSGYHIEGEDTYSHPWDIGQEAELSTDNPSGFGPNGDAHSMNYHLSEGSRYANYDWGVYNAISNGGNSNGLWRTLTREEWDYLLSRRTNADNLMALNVTVNGQNGFVLLPDNWSGGSVARNSSYTVDQWNTLEAAGAVFLPAEGYRSGHATTLVEPDNGYYWSSSTINENNNAASVIKFKPNNVEINAAQPRYDGASVRLVFAPYNNAWITVSDQLYTNKDTLNPFIQTAQQASPKPINVHVIRTLSNAYYSTLCLPFDVSEEEMKATFGDGVELASFVSASLSPDKRTLNVNFESQTAMQSGVPYIIKPDRTVVNFDFYNRIIRHAIGDGESPQTGSELTYVGILNRYHLESGNKTNLFLLANNTLIWSDTSDATDMYALRCYFHVPDMIANQASSMQISPRLCVSRASSASNEFQTTTDDNLIRTNIAEDGNPRVQKILQNGRVYILRNGVMYNLQGQRL